MSPKMDEIEIKVQHLLAGSSASANGLDGAEPEEYTGGSVNW